MKQHLLFANKSYDTSIQVLKENQIVVHHGMGASVTQFVVYKIECRNDSYIYHLINIETGDFSQTDFLRPLKDKSGIGFYYNDETPEFMDAYEVLLLQSEAEYKAKAKQEAKQKEQERKEQLKSIGKERLQNLMPADTKAVIIAELHEDDSDSMTDYFGYNIIRTVILGFSAHTKDMFSELRKYALNFAETAHLAEVSEKYEHREKYAGGEGYYLGESKYHGWIIKKEKYYRDRESIINGFSLIAGEESNICVKEQQATNLSPMTVAGDFLIVDYSQKALALFGDTRPIKDQLKVLGGRFNPKLTHEGSKQAGWIFSKSKENELKNLLKIK
ncbi:MAG: fusion protein [Candidatus Azobacteroides sp.]|nr:fusion protein [Candidatus Azobacteroides sp.]